MRSQPKCFWPCLGAWEKGAGAASSQPEIEGGENRSYLQNLCQMNTNKYLNNIATLSPLSSIPRFWTIFGREHHTCSIHITLGARNFPTTKSASGPHCGKPQKARPSQQDAGGAKGLSRQCPCGGAYNFFVRRFQTKKTTNSSPPDRTTTRPLCSWAHAVNATPSARGHSAVASVRLVKNPFGEDRTWCSFVWSFGGFPLWYKGNPSYPHKATPQGKGVSKALLRETNGYIIIPDSKALFLGWGSFRGGGTLNSHKDILLFLFCFVGIF